MGIIINTCHDIANSFLMCWTKGLPPIQPRHVKKEAKELKPAEAGKNNAIQFRFNSHKVCQHVPDPLVLGSPSVRTKKMMSPWYRKVTSKRRPLRMMVLPISRLLNSMTEVIIWNNLPNQTSYL